jgi:hypothetical protein
MTLFLCILAVVVATQAAVPVKRVSEPSLARLRPGVDRIQAAEKRFPAKFRVPASDAEPRSARWRAPCSGRELEIDWDEQSLIQSVSVSSPQPHAPGCDETNETALSAQQLATGKGLHLGDGCARTTALYGSPDSRLPSLEGGRERELLYYSFGWAGPEVPQVMEVTCDRGSARVVRITLAFPSL